MNWQEAYNRFLRNRKKYKEGGIVPKESRIQGYHIDWLIIDDKEGFEESYEYFFYHTYKDPYFGKIFHGFIINLN